MIFLGISLTCQLTNFFIQANNTYLHTYTASFALWALFGNVTE